RRAAGDAATLAVSWHRAPETRSRTVAKTMIDDVILRRAETPADYRALQDAQRSAWGVTEESYIVPIATMVGAQMHGGLVLGAFLPSGEAVAVSFAFLGRIGGR